jgi:hypothetical protein
LYLYGCNAHLDHILNYIDYHDIDNVLDHIFDVKHYLVYELHVKYDFDNFDDFLNNDNNEYNVFELFDNFKLDHKLDSKHDVHDKQYKLDSEYDIHDELYFYFEHNINDNYSAAVKVMEEMIKPDDVASENPAYWVDLNQIRLQSGQWSFEDRPYLKEILLMSMFQRMGRAPKKLCIMKATGLGYTESAVNDTLHGQIHGHYPKGVLYLFPTSREVNEFSKSRFNPLIYSNPTAIGQYVTDVVSKTDTATLKNVNGSMLFLRGARMTMSLEAGNKEGSQLRSIQVDRIIFDELDMMDFEDVIAKAEGRLRSSEVGTVMFLSNPTLPDRGIATLYDKSDQRHWYRKCGCGGWTCAEEEFPDLIGRGRDGKGYVACKKCGKPTDFRKGQWVPKFRNRSDYMWGYQQSHLTSSIKYNDPLDVLHDYNDPPQGNIGDIVRLRLGKPFISVEDRLTTGQVLALCSNRLQLDRHEGPCAMGVDVRKHKNVIIGCRSGRDRYSILRVARITDWDDILRMAERFRVKSCVVDSGPGGDAQRQFQKKARFKVWLCQYRENAPSGTQYHDKLGIVSCGRTEICDATHRIIAGEKELDLPADCPEVRQFARECCNSARVELTDKRTKQTIYRYIKLDTGPDDYRHALNYFYLAATSGHLPVVNNRFGASRSAHAKTEYARN